MSELKKCPFCGNDAVMVRVGAKKYHIECLGCPALFKSTRSGCGMRNVLKSGWNLRSQIKEAGELSPNTTKVQIVELVSELEDNVMQGSTCHHITTRLKRAAQKL